MNKLKIYSTLFKWIRKKYKEEHLNKYHNDIKCPNCNVWFSVSGIDHKHEYDSDLDFGCSVICGQCGHTSYWNLVAAPVALSCNEKGHPL